ncbi:ATP-binding protein [Sinimarinibacterium flocculans]|uniref:ATP-binding protein n=1 Tax=Sinimarinibacterium flocculans TaxID=985250 RepID=UPI00351989C3
MVFKVKARVLLELGAELISSDGIALYELIKNAIDANSESVDVRVQIALTPSGYRLLDQELSAKDAESPTAEYVDKNISRCFEPSTSETLKDEFRRQLIGKKPSVARENLKRFFRQHTYIEIEDWGCGMSKSDLEDYYLTVGTPNRLHQRLKDGRRILGEKGIGRLSTMRLGNYLEVITAPVKTTHWQHLTIDWSELGDFDMDIGSFAVKPEVGTKKDSGSSGTLIRVRDLRADWSIDRLMALSEAELAKLQDPFDERMDRLDLALSFNGDSVRSAEELDREWLKTWHGYFDVSFSYVLSEESGSKEPVLTGIAKFRVPGADPTKFSDEIDEREIHAGAEALFSLQSDPAYPAAKDGEPGASSRFDGIDTLGPFTARGYWFNRQRSQRELGEQYASFRRWLRQWAGGLLMYRDGFRVYPYAAPDDDWLELDHKALKARSFKLNRSQFVGYVRIGSKENPYLRDQTNRQGLCDAPEKRALVEALRFAIWKELGTLVSKYEVKANSRSFGTLREIDKQVKEKSRNARTTLRELGRRIPKEQETIQRLQEYVEDIEAAWSKTKAALKRQEDQAEMYMHLAGVGMLLEFVVHELTRVTKVTLQDLKGAQQSTLPPGLRSLSKQLQTLEKRLRILDPVSTPGRQRKELADVGEIIRTLIDAHEQQFERHEITCTLTEKGGPLKGRLVAGQMYQIFENLISNSVYWLTHHKSVTSKRRNAKPFHARIDVIVDGKAATVSFVDNGSGIDVTDQEKIFDPFFSKKPAGRGIGLYIVKNLCNENAVGIELLPAEKGRIPGFVFKFE